MARLRLFKGNSPKERNSPPRPGAKIDVEKVRGQSVQRYRHASGSLCTAMRPALGTPIGRKPTTAARIIRPPFERHEWWPFVLVRGLRQLRRPFSAPQRTYTLLSRTSETGRTRTQAVATTNTSAASSPTISCRRSPPRSLRVRSIRPVVSCQCDRRGRRESNGSQRCPRSGQSPARCVLEPMDSRWHSQAGA